MIALRRCIPGFVGSHQEVRRIFLDGDRRDACPTHTGGTSGRAPAFGLDAGCGSDYFTFTKRSNCWLVSARKSETQVFPTFLFAGCHRDGAVFTAYESDRKSVV